MPFGVVSEVGRWMGVLDRVGDRRREGAVLGVNLGRPIVTYGYFVAYVRERRAVPKLFWENCRTVWYWYHKTRACACVCSCAVSG